MPPEFLYKYRSVNKFTLASLINRSVWFSSPVDFNDPFDCQISIEHTKPSRVRFEEMISREVQSIASKLKSTILCQKPRGIFSDESLSKEFCEEIKKFKLYLEIQLQELGVLSLSEISNSTTMWGHYSAGHTGICIGYKTSKILPENRIDDISLKVKYFPREKIAFNAFELYARYAPTCSEAKLKEILAARRT